MKRISLIISFIIISQAVFCRVFWFSAQNIDYDKKNSRGSLTINLCDNTYGLSYFLFDNYYETSGKLEGTEGFYICNVYNVMKIRLKKIDKYRLQVLNKSLFFHKNELLYCHSIDDCNHQPIENGMFWENGLRETNWSVYTKTGIITTKYKKGRKIKVYFKTYEEIDEISSKLPKM